VKKGEELLIATNKEKNFKRGIEGKKRRVAHSQNNTTGKKGDAKKGGSCKKKGNRPYKGPPSPGEKLVLGGTIQKEAHDVYKKGPIIERMKRKSFGTY